MPTEPCPSHSQAAVAVALLVEPPQPATPHRVDTPAAPPIDGPALVEAHLPVIDKAIAFVSRRYRLTRDEAQELASDVYLRLLQHNAAALRTYRGDSSLRTFLVVVIRRVLLDAHIARAGKWRPSTDARRLGRVAIALERHVFYEGLSVHEAGPLVRHQLGATHTDDELLFLLTLLPARTRRRMVGEPELEHLRAAGLDPEARLLRAESEPDPKRLAEAFAGLPEADRRLIALRFGKGLRLCDIARAARTEEKQIYRRFQGVLATLRAKVTPIGTTPRRPLPSQRPALARR
jgi:RNA polymerase sigma factor (sigma-70 family)